MKLRVETFEIHFIGRKSTLRVETFINDRKIKKKKKKAKTLEIQNMKRWIFEILFELLLFLKIEEEDTDI